MTKLVVIMIWVYLTMWLGIDLYKNYDSLILSQKVYNLELAIESLRKENRKLEFKLYSEFSDLAIRERAYKLGYKEPRKDQLVYITN